MYWPGLGFWVDWKLNFELIRINAALGLVGGSLRYDWMSVYKWIVEITRNLENVHDDMTDTCNKFNVNVTMTFVLLLKSYLEKR